MRGCDEDEPAHEWHRLDDECLLQQFAGLIGFWQLVRGNAENVVPETVARVHGRQLGEHPALAVPNHHHLVQATILLLRVHAIHRGRELVAQQHA